MLSTTPLLVPKTILTTEDITDRPNGYATIDSCAKRFGNKSSGIARTLGFRKDKNGEEKAGNKTAVRRAPKAEGTASLQTRVRVACTHRKGAAEQSVYVAVHMAVAVALLRELFGQVGGVKGNGQLVSHVVAELKVEAFFRIPIDPNGVCKQRGLVTVEGVIPPNVRQTCVKTGALIGKGHAIR